LEADGRPSKKAKLSDFRKNVYSQCGEDGIIEKIFETIGTTSKLCVEFGAWDGFHLSNTAALWTKNWKGILLEANPARYQKLVENVKRYPCLAIQAKVGSDETSRIESILGNHGIHEPIDLLSMDIDGNDYYVFQSLRTLRPRVIICEYNPTIPAHIDVYPEPDNYFGCSVAALMRVAKSKGYQLAALTDVNAFFVHEDEFDKLAEFETALEQIRIDDYLTYLITSYSGEYVCISSNKRLPYGCRKPYRKQLNGRFHRPIRKFNIE